jgi:hypothetical protein
MDFSVSVTGTPCTASHLYNFWHAVIVYKAHIWLLTSRHFNFILPDTDMGLGVLWIFHSAFNTWAHSLWSGCACHCPPHVHAHIHMQRIRIKLFHSEMLLWECTYVSPTGITKHIKSCVMTVNVPITPPLSPSCTHIFIVNLTGHTKKELLTAWFSHFCTQSPLFFLLHIH